MPKNAITEAAPVVCLNLSALKEGIPALTKHLGGSIAEAAAVCLREQSHATEVELLVRHRDLPKYRVRRQRVTAKMTRAYVDRNRTTDMGACGVALLLVRHQTGLTAIEQSFTGTGFDYWLGDDLQADYAFQDRTRLEVSGIRFGDERTVKRRVKEKLEQTKQSDHLDIEAFVAIVEFSVPQAEVVKR